jgi:hypothetical protein
VTIYTYRENGLLEVDAILTKGQPGQIMLSPVGSGRPMTANLEQLRLLSHEINVAQQWVNHHDGKLKGPGAA